MRNIKKVSNIQTVGISDKDLQINKRSPKSDIIACEDAPDDMKPKTERAAVKKGATSGAPGAETKDKMTKSLINL